MISIIIPTKNEISVIEKTLMQFSACKRGSLELIVSDGKSTDGTIEAARKCGAKVVIYSGAKRQTIGMGRNAGAKVATGEYLAFFDADITVPEPEHFFEKCISLFETRPDILAFTTHLRVSPGLEHLSDRIIFSFISLIYRFQNNFLHLGAASGECMIVRRSAFEKIGGFRENLPVSEDQDLFRRLSKIGRTYFYSGLTVFHTGRRIRKVGWPRLLTSWMLNNFYLWFFGRSFHSEWEEVR